MPPTARCAWLCALVAACAAPPRAAGAGCGELTESLAACEDVHCPQLVVDVDKAYCVVGAGDGTRCDADRACEGGRCEDINEGAACHEGSSYCVCRSARGGTRSTGLWCAAVAGVLSGIMFLPFWATDQLDKQGDPLSQFFMACGFCLVCSAGSWWRQGAGMHPLATLGGVAVALANTLLPIVTSMLGAPLAMTIWGLTSLVVAWLVGFFGIGSLPPATQDGGHGIQTLTPLYSILGVVLASAGLVVFSAVEMHFGSTPPPVPSPTISAAERESTSHTHFSSGHLASQPQPIHVPPSSVYAHGHGTGTLTPAINTPVGDSLSIDPHSTPVSVTLKGRAPSGDLLGASRTLPLGTARPQHIRRGTERSVSVNASDDERAPLVGDSPKAHSWTGVWHGLDRASSRRGLDRDPPPPLMESVGAGSFSEFVAQANGVSCSTDHPMLVGGALSLLAGTVYGLYLLPVVLLVINSDDLTTSSGSGERFSRMGVDYTPSMAGGFLTGSIVHLCIAVQSKYCDVDYLNLPGILLPALAAGVLWGCGQAFLLEAVSHTSLAAVVCTATPITAVLASCWKIVCFPEAFRDGPRNVWFFAAALVLSASGVGVACLSVVWT